MRSKKFIRLGFVVFVFVIILVGATNYIVDPYGFISNKNKFDSDLTTINKPSVTNIKIKLNADYYLIGTSRAMRINPNLVEKYLLDKKVFNINISGATFKENSMLANIVYENNSSFIYGFDAFSLNKNRLKESELVERYKSYKDELNSNFILKNYFNIDFFSTSLKFVLNKIFAKDINAGHILENTKNYKVTLKGIDEHLGLSNQKTKKIYTNFEIVNDSEIIGLAQITTSNDIFIIYPKHFYHYVLFQKYQNIEAKYFHAIELIVKNTDAKVWSFYGINTITLNENNFDENGWHFKPKISDLIFAKIFNDKSVNVPDDFGVLVTKQNIDEHLQNLRKQIKNYDLNKTLAMP